MMEITFPDMCATCKEPFAENEPRVGILYAGSAWKNGQAEIVDGAELYRAATYHEHCAPPQESA